MPYYRRRGAPRKPRMPRKSRAAKPRVSQAVKRYVKRSIHSNIENQTKSVVYLNNAVPSSTGYSQPLIPALSQGGTDVEKRRGNEISLRGGYVKGYVNLLPFNGTTNPQSTVHVRMMIVSMKDENVATFDAGNIWQFGNSSLGVQNNIGDCLYQVNKDLYTVYEQKTVTLGATSITNTVSTFPPNIMSNLKSTEEDMLKVTLICYLLME